MSKGIMIVDIPECCDLCRFSSQAYDLEPFEDGEGYCSIKMKSLDQIQEGEKPDWCPIRLMPEKSNITPLAYNSYLSGWNDCLDELLKSSAGDGKERDDLHCQRKQRRDSDHKQRSI